mmetsp:Transcript_12028/g.19893  ORF Transcript_12028/g.19893 Transcript_12028/m.19893 type:complete len:219 (-) Transcript_12028:256-912(-)
MLLFPLFIRSFNHSFNQTINRSFVHSFIHSLICLPLTQLKFIKMLLRTRVGRNGFFFLIVIKVRAVKLITNGWAIWRYFGAGNESIPVDCTEEGVIDYVFDAPTDIAQTESRVDRQKLFNQSDVLRIHTRRKRQHLVGSDDILENLRCVICLERRTRQVQLVDKTAECPIVNTLVVPFRHNNLWSQVLRSTTQRVGFVLLHAVLQIWEFLRETKINHF